MYDETLDELIRTIESYRACVREYPMLEPTFLIDAKWVFSHFPIIFYLTKSISQLTKKQ